MSADHDSRSEYVLECMECNTQVEAYDLPPRQDEPYDIALPANNSCDGQCELVIVEHYG
jgi:hypothetical protein